MFFAGILVCVALLFDQGLSIVIEAKYPRDVVSLFLRGDGCGLNWSKGKKMNKVDSVTWQLGLNCSSTSSFEVKALVSDKDWMVGSNHHVDSKNSLDVFYPWFYSSKGKLTIIKNVFSKELSNFRDVIFYLPPSYEENTLKVYSNVLIMHDGQNLFDPKTSAFGTAWMCQDTLDGMIVSGKSDEILVAGAYNTADRNNEYTYIYDPSENCGGKGDKYLDWIESTLIPLVQSNFRVSIIHESLGLMGSSLGGLISCYAGWTRPSIYGKVGCMSSSFWWDDQDFQHNIISKYSPVAKDEKVMVYMDAGTGSVGEAECALYTSQIFNYSIANYGYLDNVNMFKYVAEGAQHNEASWGKRFYIPIGDLYPSSTV